METKERIRRRLLDRRDRLDRSEVRRLSGLIGERFLESNLIGNIRKIALYSPIRNEVQTDWIFQKMRELGKRIFFPRVTGEEIEFAAVESLDDMTRGAWGIREPAGGEPVSFEELEMIVVPGVAFDENGNRIGFGKGYYDRALKKFKGSKVGLAYEFQLLKEIPVEAGDFRCGWIVTENRLIPVKNPRG